MIDADAGEIDSKKCMEKLQSHKAAQASNLFITPVMSCEAMDEQNDRVIGVLLTYSRTLIN